MLLKNYQPSEFCRHLGKVTIIATGSQTVPAISILPATLGEKGIYHGNSGSKCKMGTNSAILVRKCMPARKFFCSSVYTSLCQSADRLVGWLVGWLVGQLVGWSVISQWLGGPERVSTCLRSVSGVPGGLRGLQAPQEV